MFDVESIGLHGDAFAVGFTVVDIHGKEHDCGKLACDPKKALGDESDREWVSENIPHITPNYTATNELRVYFWQKWQEWKGKGAWMAADCAWPVEARFLNYCVDWDQESLKWTGPYPLLDISSVLFAFGIDPLQEFPRNEAELPKHDPLCDARQSARILIEHIALLFTGR